MKILRRWRECADTVMHLLYPRRCAVCDGLLAPQEQRGIHCGCQKELRPVQEPACMHCGRPLDCMEQEYCHDCSKNLQRTKMPYWDGTPFSYITQGKMLFWYQGAIKQTMYRFKYSNRREYADFLADAACERWGNWIRQCGIEAVVPVPMYQKKEKHRGYNQAALFARAIAHRMDLDYAPGLVRRVRDTKPQKQLNDIERKNNLKNAFQTGNFIVQYRWVLLVDDIYTTGSTAEAVAKELYMAGVERIYFLAVCAGKGL